MLQHVAGGGGREVSGVDRDRLGPLLTLFSDLFANLLITAGDEELTEHDPPPGWPNEIGDW